MDLNKKCFFLITGASRGIGKTMAIECCKLFKTGSVAVLIARSKDGLDETKSKIVASNSGVTVKTYSIDLQEADAKIYNETISDALNGHNANEFELAFVLHNVGSTGDLSKRAKEVNNVQIWIDYYKLNMFSLIALNVEFIKMFESQTKLIVNVTSKCGIVPFESMAYYSSGKAGREMYFRVLAVEEPDIIVLNYSPGPVETDMSLDVQNTSHSRNLSESFKQLRDSKTILTTEQTTAKFLSVLSEMKFKSGDHVDYYS